MLDCQLCGSEIEEGFNLTLLNLVLVSLLLCNIAQAISTMDINHTQSYGVNRLANNKALEVSSQDKNGLLSTGREQYELDNLSATVNSTSDTRVTEADKRYLHKASLAIGIALATAVLALVVAVVSVGLNTALNSNSEIQSLIEGLSNQISALQTNTTTQHDILNQTVNSIQDTLREHSDFSIIHNPKGSVTNPARSCSEILTDKPSGEYWIFRNFSLVQVYCDMNKTFGNTTGGWMRVANLDMTDSKQQCPCGFLQQNKNVAPLRTCGRPGPQGCVSTTFPVHGIEYLHVCGRVIGYQVGNTDAFLSAYNDRDLTIDDYYVDGVSLTHGQLPRKHIWTFASALDEVDQRNYLTCPCTQSDITYTGFVPPFIGHDYFCDTGSRFRYQNNKFYSDDPLWNGQGCGGTSTCCSFNNPPWFCRQLPQPTTDDIELRLCGDEATNTEDVFLELVDISVQ